MSEQRAVKVFVYHMSGMLMTTGEVSDPPPETLPVTEAPRPPDSDDEGRISEPGEPPAPDTMPKVVSRVHVGDGFAVYVDPRAGPSAVHNAIDHAKGLHGNT